MNTYKLPRNVAAIMLQEIDLVTLFKSSEIDKEWYKYWQSLLSDENENSAYFWQLIYEHPKHYATLCHGELWKRALLEACEPQPTKDRLLTTYLKQTFDVDLPRNETVSTFFDKCFHVFLGTVNSIKIGTQFFCSSKHNNYVACQDYLKRKTDKGIVVETWSAKSMLEEINKLLMLLHSWVGAKKIDRSSLQLEKSKQLKPFGFNLKQLEDKDYKILVKTLLQLRQLEQMLTTVILLYKCDGLLGNTNEKLSVLTDTRWSHLLTLRGLLAICAHDATLNPGRHYEEVYIDGLPEETRKIYYRFESKKVITEEQRTYFNCIKKWGGEATEGELLEAFDEHYNYLLLIEELFLARLSDKKVLELVLGADTEINFVFDSACFVQRLRLILLSVSKEEAAAVLLGLIGDEFKFADQKFKCKRESCYASDVAHGILLHPQLTQFLTNEQLLTVVKKYSNKTEQEKSRILLSNPDLIKRLITNLTFSGNFEKEFSYTSFQLKLQILGCLSKQIAAFASHEIRDLIQNCKGDSLIINICEEELLERDEILYEKLSPSIPFKNKKELMQLALNSNNPLLAHGAAVCLEKRQGIETQLTDEEFIHRHRDMTEHD